MALHNFWKLACSGHWFIIVAMSHARANFNGQPAEFRDDGMKEWTSVSHHATMQHDFVLTYLYGQQYHWGLQTSWYSHGRSERSPA